MGEGLIGLIILIVVLNVLGRILRAITSAQKRPTGKGPARQAAVPRTREQQILRELLDLEQERQRTFEEGETIEAAKVPETELPEQAAGFEGGDEPKDATAWSEERFEERAAETEAFAYRTVEVPAAEPGALAAVAAPERMVMHRRRKAVSPTRLQCMLGDVTSLRTAVLLSVILGPCRAKRRHR